MNFGNIQNDKKALNPTVRDFGSAAPIKELIGRSLGFASMPFGGVSQLAVDPTPANANVFVRKFSPHWAEAVAKYGTKKLPWGETVAEVPTGHINYNLKPFNFDEEAIRKKFNKYSDDELKATIGHRAFNALNEISRDNVIDRAVENYKSNFSVPLRDIVDPKKYPEFYYDSPDKRNFIVQYNENLGGLSGAYDPLNPNKVNINSEIANNLEQGDRDAFIRQTIDHESTHAVDKIDINNAYFDTGVYDYPDMETKYKIIGDTNKPNMYLKENPIAQKLDYMASPQEWIARQAQYRTYLSPEQLKSTPLSYGNTGSSLPFGAIIKDRIQGKPFNTSNLVNTSNVGTYTKPSRYENKLDWVKDRFTQGKYKDAGAIIKKHADDFNYYTYKGFGAI